MSDACERTIRPAAAVVLAAGLGRRLATVTALPKWLVPVGEDCPAAAQLDPTRSTTYSELGAAQVSKGDRVAAEAAFRKAVEVNPKSALALASLHYGRKAEWLRLSALARRRPEGGPGSRPPLVP